jgi:uncharacterized phiE125 gp8 family phage protein
MAEFITLDDMKLHLRVDGTDEDALIAQLIRAAVQHVERVTGWVCGPERAVTYVFDAFDDALRIPLRPVKAGSVTLAYLDMAGASQAFTDIRVVEQSGVSRVLPSIGSAWPIAADAAAVVTLSATVGYDVADLATKPDEAPRAAVKLMVGHWFANREAVSSGQGLSEVPQSAAALLDLCAERRA